MKKLLLIAALIVALMFPVSGGAAELLNVTSAGVDGNLVFYDKSGNIIMTLDAANRKLSFPSGSLLETLGTTITIGNISYTVPTDNGAASQFLQTDGSGVLSWAGGASTAWDDLGPPDALKTHAMTTYAQTFTSTKTDGDMFNFQGLGAFGDVSVMRIEQKTGLATDGTVLEVISADADVDALLVTANSTDILQIYGSGAIKINSLEFDVSETTGAITINDGGDAGQISIEGTVLDINSLDFVGAGAITAAASNAITINPNAGDAAGEDLIITAHNLQLTAAGAMTLSPDGAVVTAITITDTDYTNALSVGDNAILGTTGAITYTNWNINADGDFVGVDATFSGAVNVGTWKQDAVVAATATTTITVDGTTTGGVTIGGTSTGTVTLGGGATLVNLPSTVDLVLAGGDLTVTDTANADMVIFTNNTMTTADLLTLSATGTRTSDNVIEIVDGATTADTIGITANTQTSGNGISYTNTGLGLTGAALYMAITDDNGFTGYYIRAFDGAANDFSVRRYGATVIAGNAKGTDALTLTAGDILVTSGHIDMTTGNLAVAEGTIDATVTTDIAHSINRNLAAAGSAAALTVAEQNAASTQVALAVTNAGTVGTGLTVTTSGVGNATGTSLVHSGDLATLAITAGAARTGDIITVNMDNQLAEKVIAIDAGAWTGTAGEGAIEFVSDVAATVEAGQAIRVSLRGTGTSGTAITGKALYAHAQAGVIAGESLVYLDTLFNTAIHISNEGATADGIKFDVADAYTGQGIIADLGPHVGTVSEGFIHIETDAAATDVAGQILRINLQDSLVDTTAISGKAIYAKEVSPFKSGTYLVHFESTSNGSLFLSGPVSLQAAAPLVGASPIVLEGATADAFEVIIAVTDPKLDSTLTLPAPALAAGGNIASYIVGGTTTDSESEVATETIDESTVAIPALHAAAGQTYVWEMAGTKTGANDTFACQLDLAGTNSLTLTSPDAAAGDWVCRITLQLTGAATQKMYGELLINGKSPVVDYATGIVNLAGAVNVGLELVLANAADEVAAESVIVRYNE